MSHRAIGQQFDPEGKPGFEDRGQGYLWPSKMPSSGTTRGNEGMHLYRGVELTQEHTDPQAALQEVLSAPARDHPYRPDLGGKEPGSTLGRHWTHDRDWAKGYGQSNVVLEAEHPGYGAVMDWDKDREEADATVVNHRYIERALPEVPIRAGSPMRVRAVHLYNKESDRWDRHEVDHRSKA